MTFLDELMLVMKGIKGPIWVLKLNLNLVGFLRTDSLLDNQIRVQIQEPASFTVWGGPDETGSQSFQITYRLFAEQKIEGEHSLLWSMNQPLLERALNKWEAQAKHKIDIVKSNSSKLPIGRKGFTSAAPPNLKPDREIPEVQTPSMADIDDDLMPDLGDLLAD